MPTISAMNNVRRKPSAENRTWSVPAHGVFIGVWREKNTPSAKQRLHHRPRKLEMKNQGAIYRIATPMAAIVTMAITMVQCNVTSSTTTTVKTAANGEHDQGLLVLIY